MTLVDGVFPFICELFERFSCTPNDHHFILSLNIFLSFSGIKLSHLISFPKIKDINIDAFCSNIDNFLNLDFPFIPCYHCTLQQFLQHFKLSRPRENTVCLYWVLLLPLLVWLGTQNRWSHYHYWILIWNDKSWLVSSNEEFCCIFYLFHRWSGI